LKAVKTNMSNATSPSPQPKKEEKKKKPIMKYRDGKTKTVVATNEQNMSHAYPEIAPTKKKEKKKCLKSTQNQM
jgi:hypothetical protein